MTAHPWREKMLLPPPSAPTHDWRVGSWFEDAADLAALAALVPLGVRHRVTAPPAEPDRTLVCEQDGAHVVCHVIEWKDPA